MDRVRATIDSLRKKGVILAPWGHRLRMQGPLDLLDEGDRSFLREHRLEVVKALLEEASIQHDPFELSNIQRRMPLGQGVSRPGDHVRSLHEFTGELDVNTLASAGQLVLQQNPILRTIFIRHMGRIHQQVNPAPFFQVDIIEPEEGVGNPDVIMRYVDRPFDLATAPLFRIGVRPALDGQPGLIAIVAHHALVDGFSSSQLNRAISSNYNLLAAGKLPDIDPEQPIIDSYRAYCRKTTASADQATVDQWKSILGNNVVGSFIPCDEPAAYEGEPEFKVKSLTVDREFRTMLNRTLTEHACSMGALALALSSAIIRLTSGDGNVTLGTTLSDRFDVASEESISNMALDLLTSVDVRVDQTAAAHLSSIQQQMTRAIEAPYCPIEQLISEGMLPPVGQRQLRMPMVTASYEVIRSIQLDGVKSSRRQSTHENPFLGLSLRTVHGPDTLRIELEYDAKLVSEHRIVGIAGLAGRILEFLARDGDEALGSIEVPDELTQGTALGRGSDSGEASRTGPDSSVPFEYPRNGIESIIAGLWSSVLGHSNITRSDGFFSLGGDSLKLVRFIDRARSESGIEFAITNFIGDPPLKALAEMAGRQSAGGESNPCIPLSDGQEHPKVFCLPGIGGVPTFSFRSLSLELEGTASLMGIQLPGIDGHSEPASSMPDLTNWVVDAIMKHRNPGEPILLAGYSIGGLIAMEARATLQTMGEEVLDPVLIATTPPLPLLKAGLVNGARKFIRRKRLANQVRNGLRRNEALAAKGSGGELERRIALGITKMRLIFSRYSPSSRYRGSCSIFLEKGCNPATRTRWNQLVEEPIRYTEIETSHNDIIEDGTGPIGAEIDRLIRSIHSSRSTGTQLHCQ